MGIVGFASAIPALFITPWAGVVVDQSSKRRLLVATQTVGDVPGFILSVLTFTDVVQVWHVVAWPLALGVLNAFDGPARQAFVVEMVGREHLSNAIALNSMAFNGARIIGPAVGGILLASVGAAWCFLLNGVTFLAVIFSLFMMQLPPHEPKRSELSPWAQFRGGVAYVSNEPDLRALLLLALFFSLFGISYATVLPAFVDRVLRQGAAAFGTINMMTGVGAVSGAFFVAQYAERGGRGRWLSMAILAFPVVLTVFSGWIPLSGAHLAMAVALWRQLLC